VIVGAVFATLIVGALVALQPPVNSELGRRTSDLGAAFISVSVTFLVLSVIFLIFGDTDSLTKLKDVPLVYLTGGLYGAAFVAISLITVRILGAGLTIALLISAQLIVAALLDHFGALGLDEVSVSPARVTGVGALLLGSVLMSLDL
jgi:bacterial/archaeal transporter family-2 protein